MKMNTALPDKLNLKQIIREVHRRRNRDNRFKGKVRLFSAD